MGSILELYTMGRHMEKLINKGQHMTETNYPLANRDYKNISHSKENEVHMEEKTLKHCNSKIIWVAFQKFTTKASISKQLSNSTSQQKPAN